MTTLEVAEIEVDPALLAGNVPTVLVAPLRQNLERVGAAWERDAKAIVPIDTGDLKSTIRYELAAGNVLRLLAGGIPGEVTGRMVDYATYVDSGTSRMGAQPFMRPPLAGALRAGGWRPR